MQECEKYETPVIISEKSVSNIEENVEFTVTYTPVDDDEKPDFDIDRIRNSVETCIYMELPLWKRKMLKLKDNLTKNYEVIKSLPSMKDYLMETLKVDQLNPDEKLKIVNELQKQEGDLNVQIKSVIDKYDVNMKFIDEILARIEERIAAEKEAVEGSLTSEKTSMLIQMVENNVASIKESKSDLDPVRFKNLDNYKNMMVNLYGTRQSLEWLWDTFDKGNSIPSIYNLYYRLIQGKKDPSSVILKRIEEVFRFNTLPSIPDLTEDEELFFYYYLCYISFTKESKKINVRRREIKERCISVFQNLGDCNEGLFDIGDENTSNEEKANVYYHAVGRAARMLYYLATKNKKVRTKQ